MKRFGSIVASMLLIGILALSQPGYAAQEKLPVTSLARLAQPGISIAVGLNTPAETSLRQDYPEAGLIPYSDIYLAYLDVANGRVDACVNARREMEFAIQHGFAGVRLLDENYAINKIAVGISPASSIPDLKGKLNAFIAELRSDGTLDDMYDRWVTRGEENMPDIPQAENPLFTLRVGTTGTVMPYSYYIGTELAGYDIELAYRFAAWLGARLELKTYDFGGIVPAAEAGSIDCIMSNLFYTKEKEESIPFSNVLFEVEVTAMVRDEGQAAQTNADGVTDVIQATEGVRWQDYNGKRIGVLTGPLMEDAAKEYFPDSEYLLFNSYPDCIAALLAGKIDAYLGDEPGLKSVHAEQPEIDYIHDRITQNNYSFAFRKNDPKSAALCAALNDFLARSWEDGTMQELDAIWFGTEEARKVVDQSDLTGENGTVRVVTTSTDMPFSYIKDGKNVGYDIDLVVRFCRDRGYALELGDVDFAGRIPAVESGKYDFSTDMNVTPEREEQVLFSDPTSYGGIVLGVLSRDLIREEQVQQPGLETARTQSFRDRIKASFNKTFIREGRWRLFTDGVRTTLLITLSAILFGTLLGFAVFMLCRNGNPTANRITRCCLWLVQGMPMVVLLMVLYYVVFGSVAISGVAVAVIGFTLTFGAAVFGLLKMGVGAVDGGQYEAAYALGYSNRRTFFRIILPQALPLVIPAYKGEITGLIKATAIVGYIAVQDLTKMGDIVRSRTYEAFFPLIAVTVIYFMLEGLIGFLVGRISLSLNPRRRKPAKILKGVMTDDQN
ncbi:MAG: transporter substrate-binding domain-containing protein [Oscillospiraceae bacterium]|nr:transporter substrate-binding domain-containing protein [Oscillospiraceae bacterium]